MLYDVFLQRMGDFGKYQKFQVFLLCVVAFTSSFHSLNMVFIGGIPNHHCKPIPAGPAINVSNIQKLLDWTIPKDEDGQKKECKMFNTTELERHEGNITAWLRENHTELEHCKKGWTYYQNVYRSTIVSEVSVLTVQRW